MTYEKTFRDRVYAVVATIPRGCVATYGDIAAASGNAAAARIVGGLAHYGPAELPWQRVVNRFGGLASGYPGGREAQKAHLEQDGVGVDEQYRVREFESVRWGNIINQS